MHCRQDDEETPWEEAPAHGSRSAELLSAIARLVGRVVLGESLVLCAA